MKKEENQKISPTLRNEHDLRSRSHSPKAYLGCDTCKLKNSELVKKVKSISKLSDTTNAQDKNKIKKQPPEKEKEKDREIKKNKIKLTDLCDEDKARIIELIEELSKFAEKNQQLKEALDLLQITKQEQQEYILKQANLFLEEKNFYISEINDYKLKMETSENEMKSKISQWESHERFLITKIVYLAKALQKALKGKNDLTEQLQHLKICLRQSLESFQRLRAEVTELQHQEHLVKKYKSVSCQTIIKNGFITNKEKFGPSDEDTEEEYMSTCNQDTVEAKSNLDIINDKFEHVYKLLKRKSDSMAKNNLQKLDIDLSILLKNEKLIKEYENENDTRLDNHDEFLKEDKGDHANECKFLKPFDQCSKTSIQAERILKKIGKPLNLIFNEYKQTLENNKLSSFKSDEPICEEPSGDVENLATSILQNRLVQKNHLFKSSENQYDEDRLLEELFYSDQNFKFELDSLLKLEPREAKTFLSFPFT